jgi:AraC-like DNA-binding protein
MNLLFNAVDNPENWMDMVAQQLDVPIIDGAIKLPPYMGTGFISSYYPVDWLTISYIKLKIEKSLLSERVAVKKSPYIPIMFYLDNWEQQVIDTETKDIGVNTSNGIFMPSADIGSKWMLPADKWVTNLTLTFNKDWLIRELEGKGYICQLLSLDKPFYVFEPFTSPIFEQIKQIEACIESNDINKKILLYGISIKLLGLYIKQLNTRADIGKRITGIHAVDVQTIFMIRDVIMANLQTTPKISFLAKKAGMSESKLQRCYKSIFGRSISEYALYEKMKIAKELLGSKQYSVSEIGYKLGYSNLSHFTKAFRKQYNINPKTYSSSKTLPEQGY